jgi:hypothetical protein
MLIVASQTDSAYLKWRQAYHSVGCANGDTVRFPSTLLAQRRHQLTHHILSDPDDDAPEFFSDDD